MKWRAVAVKLAVPASCVVAEARQPMLRNNAKAVRELANKLSASDDPPHDGANHGKLENRQGRVH
jgi:hypothetical protein